MNKNIYPSILFATVLALGACNNDSLQPQPEAQTPAHFFTNLDSRVQTRMADDQWANGDAIGIFTLNDETGDNLRLNMCYTKSADGWSSASPFYFKDPNANPVQFIAYYPYTPDDQISSMEVSRDRQLSGTIAVDASDQSAEGQAKFDFLYADKDGEGPDAQTPTGSKNNPNINFQFRHSMTKVVIQLLPDPEGSVSFDELKALVPTLHGFQPKGIFDLKDGTVADNDDPFADLKLYNKSEDAGKSISYAAILPPQLKHTDIAVPMHYREISLTNEANETYRSGKILMYKKLEAGKCYTVIITVKKRTLVIEDSNITDWTPEEGGIGDAILQ